MLLGVVALKLVGVASAVRLASRKAGVLFTATERMFICGLVSLITCGTLALARQVIGPVVLLGVVTLMTPWIVGGMRMVLMLTPPL